jgi:hypothetical protein
MWISTDAWTCWSPTKPATNRRALGATVRLDVEGQGPVVRRVHSGGSYLSASDDRLSLGLGSSSSPVTVTVTWPDGKIQRVTGLSVDREHTIARKP